VGESVNRSQMGNNTSVVDVIVLLYLSLGSSTIQLHDSRGSRRACAWSEAGFGS
jgi:hypothetical protein